MRFDVPVQSSKHPDASVKPKRSRKFRLPKFGKPSSNAIIIASCALVIVTLAGLSGFLYWQNNKLKNEPQANSETTAKRIIHKVKELYALPNNEQPTVAVIKDVNQLKGQPFFNGAKNGDAVLVFTKAKMAILYREDENKIIKTGPVATEDEQHNTQSGTSSGQNTGTQTLDTETQKP